MTGKWQHSTECNRVLRGSEDGGKFGIPGSLCTLGSSLADGGAQASAKNFPLTAAMICHPSDNLLQSIMMGKGWLNNFDFRTI